VRFRNRVKCVAALAVGGFLPFLPLGQQAPPSKSTEAEAGLSSSIPVGSKFDHRAANTPPSGPPLTLLGAVTTASLAESFALNGSAAYVCDQNEISVINISNPANSQVTSTASASIIANSGDINCALQRGTLAVFSVQASSTVGNSLGVVAYSLRNPAQSSVIAATPTNKQFFGDALYIGNVANVPTNAVTTVFATWDNQFGDLLGVDVSNSSGSTLLGTLEQPQISSIYGGAYSAFGTEATPTSVYIGASARQTMGRIRWVVQFAEAGRLLSTPSRSTRVPFSLVFSLVGIRTNVLGRLT
jgi:LVIVD repeat